MKQITVIKKSPDKVYFKPKPPMQFADAPANLTTRESLKRALKLNQGRHIFFN